jgi:hypothetical protein
MPITVQLTAECGFYDHDVPKNVFPLCALFPLIIGNEEV